MKSRERNNVDKFVEEHLRLFSSPPMQESVEAKERALYFLRSQTADAGEESKPQLNTARFS